MNLIIVKDLASTASFPAPRKRGYRAREMPAHYPKLPAALEKTYIIYPINMIETVIQVIPKAVRLSTLEITN